eukprot:9186083-Pyramimonas_sp.AAC.1
MRACVRVAPALARLMVCGSGNVPGNNDGDVGSERALLGLWRLAHAGPRCDIIITPRSQRDPHGCDTISTPRS